MNNLEMFRTWLDIIVFNNSIGSYLCFLAFLIGMMVALSIAKRILIYHLTKLASRTANDFDDFIISLIAQVGSPVFFAASLYYSSLVLDIGTQGAQYVRYFLILVVTIRAILILQAVVKYSVTKAYRKRIKPGDLSAEAMIRNVSNLLRWVIWVLGAIFILDNMGVNISALVAGIGIGGIAIAMASQAILGDAFSALSIFLDKPFEIGDFIIVDDYKGTVEHIGIKTTRIRSLSGEQLVLANSDLTKSRIKNYKRMELRRIAFKLGIVYNTSSQKVKKVPVIVTDIFRSIEKVRLDRVHFQSFGDFSLIYEIVYYVLSADYNIYMDKQQEINLAIKDVFERENIEFAYPTQTLYVTQQVARS